MVRCDTGVLLSLPLWVPGRGLGGFRSVRVKEGSWLEETVSGAVGSETGGSVGRRIDEASARASSYFQGFFTALRPDPWVESGGLEKLMARVGGWRFSIYHGSGRVEPTRPGLTRSDPIRLDSTRPDRCHKLLSGSRRGYCVFPLESFDAVIHVQETLYARGALS